MCIRDSAIGHSTFGCVYSDTPKFWIRVLGARVCLVQPRQTSIQQSLLNRKNSYGDDLITREKVVYQTCAYLALSYIPVED